MSPSSITITGPSIHAIIKQINSQQSTLMSRIAGSLESHSGQLRIVAGRRGNQSEPPTAKHDRHGQETTERRQPMKHARGDKDRDERDRADPELPGTGHQGPEFGQHVSPKARGRRCLGVAPG